MLCCVLPQLTAPHPQNYPNLRRAALEHLQLSPATLSSLFSDITDSWNHWVRGTGAQPNPTHHLESGKPQRSPLGCCLSSPLRQWGWRSPDTILATLWTRIFFLLSKRHPSFLSQEPAKLTAFFTDHKQSVRFLLTNSRVVALRPIINSSPNSILSRPA